MTKFCEGCPMSGDMAGDIRQIVTEEVQLTVQPLIGPTQKEIIGTYGVLLDIASNASEVVRIPRNWRPPLSEIQPIERIANLVSICEGPQVEKSKILRRKNYTCPALAKIACKNQDLIRAVKRDLT